DRDDGCLLDRLVTCGFRLVEIEAHVCHCMETTCWILGEASPERTMERGRHGRRERRPIRVATQNRGDHVGHGLAFERWSSGQHLEQHAAEGPDVRPMVD